MVRLTRVPMCLTIATDISISISRTVFPLPLMLTTRLTGLDTTTIVRRGAPTTTTTARGRRAGRALLEAVEERCRARDVSYVEVQTDEEAAAGYEASG